MSNDLLQRRGILIDIRLPNASNSAYRFQNFQPENDFFYDGEPYQYVAFEGQLMASNGIGSNSGGGTVKIVNTDAKTDSLKPVRDWLMASDGWVQAIVTLREIDPNDAAILPKEERHIILESSIEGTASAALTLRDVLTGANATVPSYRLTDRVAPELPTVSPR